MAFIQGWSLWRRALLPHDEAEGERIYLMQIEEWMKDVRKGFKIGKFVVEVEKARNSYTTVRDRITRWLEVAMHFVAFGYHLTDNRLFMGKIYYRARKIVSDDLMIRHGPKPVQGQVEFVSTLKRSKNLFSLIRCILAIICESRHVLQLTGDLNKIALCDSLRDFSRNGRLRRHSSAGEFEESDSDADILGISQSRTLSYRLRSSPSELQCLSESEDAFDGSSVDFDVHGEQSPEFETPSKHQIKRAELRELKERRMFHVLMLVRVMCYFTITASKGGLLPKISLVTEGFLSMAGAAIAVWKNLPKVILSR